MYLRKWSKMILEDPQSFINMHLARTNQIIIFDTETTGLNLKNDKPFVITLAMEADNDCGLAIAYDLTTHTKECNDRFIEALYTATTDGLLVGHNVVFDLHMLENVYKKIPHTNIADTMTIIRLGTDALPVKAGGASLKLKEFAVKFIDKDANQYEKILNTERAKIAKEYKQQLLTKVPNKKRMEQTLEIFPNDIDDLVEEDRLAYIEWYNNLPPRLARNMKENFPTSKDIPYDMIPRDILMKYAQYDAIYTHEIYEQLMPIVKLREQMIAFKAEQKLIIPIYDMVGEGFKMNKPYVIEAKARLKSYIRERQEHLLRLAGTHVTANQNAVLLYLLRTRFNLPDTPNTQEEVLSELMYTLEQTEQNPEAITFISIILELRTLSKWYTTYLMRAYKEMQVFDYMYTGLNPAGAVTGRFTSDFQQFPKDPIKDYNKNELFHPRKMFIAEEGTYLFYLDYSQIELRIQALYTILLDEPDLNLCRAYFPYKCHHYRTGEPYAYNNEQHKRNYNRKQPRLEPGVSTTDLPVSIWLRDEDGIPWVKTDLHSKTTAGIFPDLDPSSKEFQKLRSEVGKRTNFACNYGARADRLHKMFPRYSREFAESIYNGYATSYPGVLKYQRYCTDLFRGSCGENLFGRKYYGTNGHNGANALVQGSGADLLKEKITLLHAFLKDYKTKMQMNIHDEISFIMPKDETYLIPKLVEIMEDVPDSYVPIVAEAEISETTWAEKRRFTLVGSSLEYID
jgi:DNA polymerase I